MFQPLYICSGRISDPPYWDRRSHALNLGCLMEIVSRASCRISVLWREIRRIVPPCEFGKPRLMTKQIRCRSCTCNTINKVFRRMINGFLPEDSSTFKSGHRMKVSLIGRRIWVQFGVTSNDHEHRLLFQDKDKTNEKQLLERVGLELSPSNGLLFLLLSMEFELSLSLSLFFRIPTRIRPSTSSYPFAHA